MNHTSAKGPSRLLLVATVLVVAANLRAALTVVGPLIERIGSDTNMSTPALGVLGALPVFSFAVVSPFVHLLSRRWGMERAVFGALLLLTLGTVLRSSPGGSFSLFVGTAVLSAALGVANVLVPIIVRRDFPDQVPTMTGVYTASLTAVAAIASGAAVPLANVIGWQYTLGAAALLSLLAAGLWSPRLARGAGRNVSRAHEPTASSTRPEKSVWTSRLAWQVTLFFGLQSSMFYFFLTWLAAIHTYHGFSEQSAGYSVAAFQAIGIVATLLVGRIMQRMADHRMVAVSLGASMALGVVGMIGLPHLMPVWAVICGLSSTATLLLALTMISLRANSPEQAAQLSGMAQGIGYLIGGSGPILAGSLFGLADSWVAPLSVMLVVIATYTTVGYFAGRNVRIGPR